MTKQLFLDEILIHISLYLTNDFYTLAQLHLTSHQCKKIATSELLWQKIYSDAFPKFTTPVKNYRFAYMQLHAYLKQVFAEGDVQLLLIGPPSSGKEAIQARYCGGLFYENFTRMIKDAYRKHDGIFNTCKYSKQIYGVGSYDIDFLSRLFFEYEPQRFRAFMFCFAIDDKQSLAELEKVLTRVTEKRSNDTYASVLVATKSDLNHAVSQNEMEQIVLKYDLDGYVVTSSKLDHNVSQAFDKCFRLAIPKLIPQDLVAKAGRGERIVKNKKKCIIC